MFCTHTAIGGTLSQYAVANTLAVLLVISIAYQIREWLVIKKHKLQ